MRHDNILRLSCLNQISHWSRFLGSLLRLLGGRFLAAIFGNFRLGLNDLLVLSFLFDLEDLSWCLRNLLLNSFFLDLDLLGNVLIDYRDLGVLSLLDLAADKSQPLHHDLEAGSLHQGLGDGAVLDLLSKRGPGALHGSDAEGVGGV